MKGEAFLILAFDLGFAIDLERAAERLVAAGGYRVVAPDPRARRALTMAAPPLVLRAALAPVALDGFALPAEVELRLFDFASCSITWRLPLDHEPEALIALASACAGNRVVEDAARGLVERALALAGDAVQEAEIGARSEDYLVVRLDPGPEANRLLEERRTIARILRCERGEIATEEVESAFSLATAHRPGERVVVDWNACVMVGRELSEELAILQVANVQLVALRYLEARLGRAVLRAYGALRPAGRGLGRLSLRQHELAAIGRIEADLAVVHEGIDDALHVLDDVYLARLQSLVRERFGIAALDRAIDRKRSTLAGIYGNIGALAAQRRSEVLEWIIIILIAVEIALSLARIG